MKSMLINAGIKKRLTKKYSQLELQSMVIPGLIFLFIFMYIPMYGLIIAFKDFTLITKIWEAPWVGFKHFVKFFTNDNFARILKNTLAINIIGMFISFPTPIIFALLLNEFRNGPFKRITQTISYVPHFVSFAIFGGLMISMLSPGTGVVNNVLKSTGLIKEPIFFMAEPKYFWIIAVSIHSLKRLGWGSIIYLAAISGVDMELYDSAIVDGAGRFRRMWHITLPSILGTIIIMLLFYISNFLNWGFEEIFILQNNLNISASELIETYVYKTGLQQLRFSYATAVGLFKSVVAIILLVSANYGAKKISGKGLY